MEVTVLRKAGEIDAKPCEKLSLARFSLCTCEISLLTSLVGASNVYCNELAGSLNRSSRDGPGVPDSPPVPAKRE